MTLGVVTPTVAIRSHPTMDAAPTRPPNTHMSPEAAEELLLRSDGLEHFRSVARLARPTHGSLLQPMEYSAALDYHHPACVAVEPDVTSVDAVRLYASAAYPPFDSVLAAPWADEKRAHLLDELYHRLVFDRQNVVLVTNHGQIIDIAVVLAGLASAMCDKERTFGVLGEAMTIADFAERSNVLVSRMVATRQAFDLPAIRVLQHLTRVWLSVPQTVSRRRVRLDPELALANNVLMRERLDRRLEKGGQLLAMAASGSQDLSAAAGLWRRIRMEWRTRREEAPPDEPSLHLQPLYPGTIRLMTQCDYVLPVATSLDDTVPACEIGAITRVKDSDDCHQIMEWIASAHERVTGVHTVYHAHEDDLLTQLRENLAKRSTAT